MASYRLSPDLPGSDESHKIRSSIEQLQNLPIQEALALSKQRATRQNIFYPEKYGAKKLGAGVYGTVYLVRMTNEIFWELASLFQYGGGKILTRYPDVPSLVVIKITKQQSGTSDSAFYQENVRENLVHKRLYTAQCLQVGTKPLCISKYVPKFFMSCIIGKPRNLRSLTVMDPAGNTDLDKFVRGKSIPVALFIEIERAICAMWLTGYIHGDLHRANIMLDTNTMAVKIIDFGFALKLPPPFVAILGRRIYNKIARGDMDSLGDIWTQKPVDGKRRLVNYTNGVMKSRGFPWYNPDYKILRTLWNQVPRKLRSQIPAARSAAWGIPIGAQQSRPQSQSRSQTKYQSPTLRPSFKKTYRSSTTAPRGSISESAKKKEEIARQQSAKRKEEMRRAESAKKKEEIARQQSAKKKEEIARQQSAKRKEEMRRAESAKKKEEIARQQSAKKKEEAMRAESAKRKQQVSRQSPSRSSPLSPRTPLQKKSPRAFFTPSSLKFTDTERAAVYGRKGNSQKMFAEIERQKMMCRQRGAVYNPITKTCSYKTPAKVFSGCRIDCGKIGKKCGPRGQCIKL
jgi:serine/threonine protein kinase